MENMRLCFPRKRLVEAQVMDKPDALAEEIKLRLVEAMNFVTVTA
jgi:hypothetical protein